VPDSCRYKARVDQELGQGRAREWDRAGAKTKQRISAPSHLLQLYALLPQTTEVLRRRWHSVVCCTLQPSQAQYLFRPFLRPDPTSGWASPTQAAPGTPSQQVFGCQWGRVLQRPKCAGSSQHSPGSGKGGMVMLDKPCPTPVAAGKQKGGDGGKQPSYEGYAVPHVVCVCVCVCIGGRRRGPGGGGGGRGGVGGRGGDGRLKRCGIMADP